MYIRKVNCEWKETNGLNHLCCTCRYTTGIILVSNYTPFEFPLLVNFTELIRLTKQARKCVVKHIVSDVLTVKKLVIKVVSHQFGRFAHVHESLQDKQP